MRKLIATYRQLSAQVQSLMRACLDSIEQGRAPGEASGHDIAQALDQLRAAYEAIRSALAEYLPGGEPSIDECEQAWLSSLAGRRDALRAVLSAFMRAYSDDAKYMSALSTYIDRARALADGLDAVDSIDELPDVSEYQLFCDCTRADLAADDELSDRIWDSALFSPRVVRGLADGRYRILPDEECAPPKAQDETPSKPISVSQVELPSATLTELQAESQSEPQPETQPEQPTEPQPEAQPEPQPEPQPEAQIEPQPEEPAAPAIIHPIIPIKPGKMPSDKKVAAMLKGTIRTMGMLMTLACAWGMVDERLLFETLSSDGMTYDMLLQDLSKLEHNGYICIYKYKERRIICFTRQMFACLMRSSVLMPFRKRSRMRHAPVPPFCGRQDVPLDEFEAFLYGVDLVSAIDAILSSPNFSSADIARTERKADIGRFVIQLRTADDLSKGVSLLCVDDEEFLSADCTSEQGAICFMTELPDMDGVSDNMHYCLTGERLYRWVDGQWRIVASRDDIDDDASPDGTEPNDEPAPGEGNEPDDDVTDDVDAPVEDATGDVDAPVEDMTGNMDAPVEDVTGNMDAPVEDMTSDMNEPAEDMPGNMDAPVEDITSDMDEPVDDMTSDIDEPVNDMTSEVNEPAEDIPSEVNEPAEDIPSEVDEPANDIPGEIEVPEEIAPLDADEPETDDPEASAQPEPEAPAEVAPLHPTRSGDEPADWLWREDSAHEGGVSSAAELAARLVREADIPDDERLAAVIRRLLYEGVRVHDPHNMHDQLVEAMVLARLLANIAAPEGEGEGGGAYRFPTCRRAYLQLNAAIPMFLEPEYPNTGEVLTEIFSEQLEYSDAALLCAYISGMLFPARAHDHTLYALCNSAFANYDAQFPGYEALKPLYHMAMNALHMVPNAFSPANLAMLSDSRLRNERMSAIQERARSLLAPPTLRSRINGIPEFLDMCFGAKSDMRAALEIVVANDLDGRELVDELLSRYSRNGKVDERKLNQALDNLWPVAAKDYSTSRLTIKMLARRNLLDAFRDRLGVMRQWMDETGVESSLNVDVLRALRGEVFQAVGKAMLGMAEAPQSAQRCIVLSSLESMRARLQGGAGAPDMGTLLRSGLIVMDGDGPAFNDELSDIRFAEPWYMMLRHIACTNYNLANAYSAILNATPDSPHYDNYGLLGVMGRILDRDPDEYEPSEDVMRSAVSSAALQTRAFRENLEISYAYNRISERDRERFALLTDPEASDFQSFFFEHRAYGCWRGFLGALKMQIAQITERNMSVVQSQLKRARAQLTGDESSPLLDEAERLITGQRNLAVAEDYIHRFRNGETSLPFDNMDSAVNHYLDFISGDTFTRLYEFCQSTRNYSLTRNGMRYLSENRPVGWSARHFEDANRFISKWPAEKHSLNPHAIADLFRLMGLDVVSSVRSTRDGEVCCTLTVNPSPQNQADYRHPIAAFGTQMKPQLEVVCLFGNRTHRQLIDDACRLGINSMYVVLLDSALSLTDRRAMAEYFFTHKNVGQAPFLVIDRVLALYLTMQPSNERLPAMLQCTLPYTIYQPFTNGSGSTADEMFFGRVSELASIRDMAGTSVVYGGRQLGKTALLERAKHLDNNPDKREFAVMTSFIGCLGERAFLDKLVPACNEAFDGHGISLSPCENMAEFCAQVGKLLRGNAIARLLLLLDETDDFLKSISADDYMELQPLVDLQRASEHRFKFVLVGLHNVCRAKNAMRKNGLFGQLGAPLCIKPLTAADARNLLVRPLRYLGFHVSNESHIDTILTNTNYYPGIIQFFGYNLVQTLASQYLHYYSALRGNPPFELRDDHLASIMSSRDLNSSIKSRLLMTLSMDDRYHMLARCIAVLYHVHSSDYSMVSGGFSAREILDVSRDMFEIRCLEGLSEGDVATLLDEMEEMGILSRNDDSGGRYLLRRRSFMDVIGPNLDVLEHDIELANEEVARDG